MSVQEKRRIEILLAHCSSPAEAGKIVPELLGRARPRDCSLRGLRVLAVPLACADPLVTAAACAWLLGQGASVTVVDSPGFGTARGVAAAIGLEAALKPLGLAVRPFTAGPAVRFSSGRRVVLAKEALEADRILSVGKFKAHSSPCPARIFTELCPASARRFIMAVRGSAAGNSRICRPRSWSICRLCPVWWTE